MKPLDRYERALALLSSAIVAWAVMICWLAQH